MFDTHNKLSAARKALKKLEAKRNGMTDQTPADEKDMVTKQVEALPGPSLILRYEKVARAMGRKWPNSHPKMAHSTSDEGDAVFPPWAHAKT